MKKPAQTAGDTRWFVHDRFGMFIHWGIYALPARHEWVKHNEQIPDEAYQKYFDHFYPDLYDPHEWARMARNAGMRYAVLTTKHHDGFCLWDSQYTDYKVTNTPWGKDLLGPYVEAFRSAGLHVGFYHSLIDWHHPQFPIDGFHPMRAHPNAKEWNRTRDVRKYAAYLHNQVRELLTQYGKIDIIFYDFSYSGARWPQWPHFRGKGKADWQSERLIALTRDLQPGIIINNRTEIPQDIITPEQFQPIGWPTEGGQPKVWETCQTFSGSWGYHRDESTWKSPEQLIQMLINTVSCGGNLLMNVGPTARGTFDDRAVAALEVYARWMRLHSRSIYGCTMSPFTPPRDCRYTQNGKLLYLHVYNWPFRHIYCPGLAGKVEYAQLLNDGSEIRMSGIPHGHEAVGLTEAQAKNMLVLEVPVVKPNVTVPVIEMFLK